MLRAQDILEFSQSNSSHEERRQVVAAFRALLASKSRQQLLKQLASVCKPVMLEGDLAGCWRHTFELLAANDTATFSRLVPLLLTLSSLRDKADDKINLIMERFVDAAAGRVAPPAVPAAPVAPQRFSSRDDVPLEPQAPARAPSRGARAREALEAAETAPQPFEEEARRDANRQALAAAVDKLQGELSAALADGQLSKQRAQALTVRLARVSLWKALCYEQTPPPPNSDPEERLLWIFPREVLSSPPLLGTLQLAGQRLQTVGTNRNPEKYPELKALAGKALQSFLDSAELGERASGTIGDPASESSDAASDASAKLAMRRKKLQAFVDALPFNQERKPVLLGAGYAAELWERPVFVEVRASSKQDLDETARKRLVTLYEGYVILLKGARVASLLVDGEVRQCPNWHLRGFEQ